MEEYGRSGNQLAQSLYVNRPNALGYLRKEFRERSLEDSVTIARRILRSTLPELSVSQINEAIRILTLYLRSLKYIPKSGARVEPVVLASAYISVRRGGGCISLFYITSKLGLGGYKSFVGLVRRMCTRMGILRLPECSFSEYLEEMTIHIERHIRNRLKGCGGTAIIADENYCMNRMALETGVIESEREYPLMYGDMQTIITRGSDTGNVSSIGDTDTFNKEDIKTKSSLERDLLLDSLLREDPNRDKASQSSAHIDRDRRSKPKIGTEMNMESLRKSRELAHEILETIFEYSTDFHVREDILDPLWILSGSSVSPVICGALIHSLRVHCKEISMKDVVNATGISKSTVINAKRLVSQKLLAISQRLFPGWIGKNPCIHSCEPEESTEDSRESGHKCKKKRGPPHRSTREERSSSKELPPTVILSLVKLLRNNKHSQIQGATGISATHNL